MFFSVHPTKLVKNRRYYIQTKERSAIVNGNFFGSSNTHLYFTDLKWYNKKINHGIYKVYINNHTFYDLEEIRDNAKMARQQMEQRALHKILKRLVNEEFEWYT